MKFAKIQFESDEAGTSGVYGLMLRGQVIALRDQVFIVPAPAIDWLIQQQIPYRMIQWLNHDDVSQALRDSLAHPVQ